MASLNLNADPEYPYRGGFNVVYGAGKTAVNAITQALSIELESSNIRV